MRLIWTNCSSNSQVTAASDVADEQKRVIERTIGKHRSWFEDASASWSRRPVQPDVLAYEDAGDELDEQESVRHAENIKEYQVSQF